jgi:hypothetical protein
MFYAKGVNCCAELVLLLNSGPDGGACMAPTDCRGFTGTCADLPEQFAEVAVEPYFPNGLSEYTCTAFPDEEKTVDSFIVGLISIAVALPVTHFLSSAFELANDSGAPESWLSYSGWPKLVLGLHAHRDWHYTRTVQPSGFVRWFTRSSEAPKAEIILDTLHLLKSWVTGAEPRWTTEAREAQEEADGGKCAAAEDDEDVDGTPPASEAGSGSTSSSAADARDDLALRRALTWAGVVGTLLTWGIFAWFIFVSSAWLARLLCAACACFHVLTCLFARALLACRHTAY